MSVKTKPVKVSVKRVQQYENRYEYVDYYTNAKDFQCVMLAAIGWTTNAISDFTELTPGQVQYRISKAEKARKKGEPTMRSKYRNGKSDVAGLLAAQITRKSSPTRKLIEGKLDERELYAPLSRGVLRDDKSLPPRSPKRKPA